MSKTYYVQVRADAPRASYGPRRVGELDTPVLSKGPVYECSAEFTHEFRATPQAFEVLEKPPKGGKLVPLTKGRVFSTPTQHAAPPPPPAGALTEADEEVLDVNPAPPPEDAPKRGAASRRTRGGAA